MHSWQIPSLFLWWEVFILPKVRYPKVGYNNKNKAIYHIQQEG